MCIRDSLGDLLPERGDRERLAKLLDAMIEEGESRGVTPTPEQKGTLERIHEILATRGSTRGSTRLARPARSRRTKAKT